MQRPRRLFVDLGLPLAAALEDVGSPFQKGFLPLVNHRRMHPVLRGQLRLRALTLHGFQRHAGLEARVVVPAFRHVLISSFLETRRRQIAASVTVRLLEGSSIHYVNPAQRELLHQRRFTAGKKNPNFLSEAEALDNLLSQGSLVAGGRDRRSLPNGSGNAKTSVAGPTEVSQLVLVAGAGSQKFLPLHQQDWHDPKSLAA